MAIQILVMTDDPSAIQEVLHALENRRVRVLVHPLDSSLLVVAREASPAAILLDATSSPERAARVQQAVEDDGGFSSVPVFALGGEIAGVTSSYEELGEPSAIAAEILAIAELTFGFQDGDDVGLFDDLDQDLDFASTLGPADSENTPSSASKPPAPPRGGPPALPPMPGVRRESVPGVRRDSVPGVPMPTRAQAPAAAERRPRATTDAVPVVESSGRETLTLKQDLLAKDREILTLRSQVMDLEEQHLEKDEKHLQSLERLAAMEAQITDFEDQLEERQADNDRLAKALDEATCAHEAERAEAQAAQQALQEERDALQAQFEEERAQLQAQLEGERAQFQAQLEEERAQLQAQLEEASKRDDLEAEIASLQEERKALIGQRDELLAITSELEAAMNEADLQAAAYAERFDKADKLVDVLRKDLGVYVEAAHRVVEERRTQAASLGDLVSQLESALEATRSAAATPEETLPVTNWEAAYNAYVESAEAANGAAEEASSDEVLLDGEDEGVEENA